MYDVVIGLELHAEMKSNRKVFSPSKNEYNEIPNINVSTVDMALPGILPRLNKECMIKALKMAKVLNCTIPEYMIFDRKNYYYPDLPKGYQITQSHYPVGIHGNFKVPFKETFKEISIQDIHLEEDTASLDHYYDYSLIDYNRVGVPLLEIVTDPCLYSTEEVISYLEYLVNVLRYCDISEADTKKGQIRCDVNVSLKPKDSKKLGSKVEIKNINSFGNVIDAINYEIGRQTEILNNKRKVLQETRRFDEETCTTKLMRSKEDSIDYKYFIEPNIPAIKITNLDEIFKTIPMLPYERKQKYLNEYGLNNYDASIIVKDINLANYFEECVNLGINPKTASNWLTSEILGVLNKEEISIKDFFITPKMLSTILTKLLNNSISSKQAKEVFNESLTNKINPEEIFKNSNISQNNNSEELENIISNIINNNLNLVVDYHNGKTNVFQYFIGQIMKETKGQANPNLVRDILIKLINKKDYKK